jgi:uncharacterized membrane protein HdeD (DUF308 family)
MKRRLFTRWTFMRILYLLAGILIAIQALLAREWPAVFIGGWFIAMGLFALGCAAGNCFSPPQTQSKKNTPDDTFVSFEEIK